MSGLRSTSSAIPKCTMCMIFLGPYCILSIVGQDAVQAPHWKHKARFGRPYAAVTVASNRGSNSLPAA